jgi:hypothetical protein
MPVPVPPSTCPFVAGPVQVWVGSGTAGALEYLGYTINGVRITERTFITGIPGDENGGDSGPPVDYQKFGDQHFINLELGKYVNSVLVKVASRWNNPTGAAIAVGTLFNCNNYSFRVLLIGPNFTRNYVSCIPMDDIERAPLGSQFTRASLTFVASVSGGVLFNTVDTGLPA